MAQDLQLVCLHSNTSHAPTRSLEGWPEKLQPQICQMWATFDKCFQNSTCKDNKLEKKERWQLGKGKKLGMLPGNYCLNVPTYLYNWGERESSLDGWYSWKIQLHMPPMVADYFSLHSSLFSIFYICPSSTKWRFSSPGHYTSQIHTSSTQMTTQHRPARWIKEMHGLCSGSAPAAVPQYLGGYQVHTVFCQTVPSTDWGVPRGFTFFC